MGDRNYSDYCPPRGETRYAVGIEEKQIYLRNNYMSPKCAFYFNPCQIDSLVNALLEAKKALEPEVKEWAVHDDC